MANQKTPKRWYDQYPKLSQAIRLIVLLPDEIVSILSEGLIEIAERDFRAHDRMNTARSLGTEKVLALHKSKNRRRDYDHNPKLHQTMNYLYILSDRHQERMSEHVFNLVQYAQTYLGTCRMYKRDYDPEDVAKMTRKYVEEGSNEVQDFLNNVREYYKELLHGPSIPRSRANIDKDKIQDDTLGMKLRRVD